jgi:hypothetical protein
MVMVYVASSVQVLGPSHTICLISDRHPGILNAAGEHIDGFPPLVHRWCMRHFAAKYWRRQRKKEVCDKIKTLCCVRTEHQLKERTRQDNERSGQGLVPRACLHCQQRSSDP